jgi:lysophospholipase L1-like esterase
MTSRPTSVAALLFCVICNGAFAEEYPDPERFRPAIDAFAVEASVELPAPGGIVATGSSSMRGWHQRINADLAPISVIPRGFGGSTMHDVRYFLDDLVLRYKPRAVLLYEGDNDIAIGITPERILNEFQAIVDEIHARLPATRVYLLAVKPSISRWSMWPDMVRTNELFAKACDENPLLTYVDVATPMLGSDGDPLEHIFVADELHMNDSGYDIWRDAVRPVLVAAEGDHE